jgi:ubiquinone/menaquinone biosynthesis C-methylase UbiE
MAEAPETYTHGHHESVLRSHRWRTAENSAGYLLDHLAGGLDLLDVGCGPGTITIDLAGLVAPGRVVGLDPSAEVIAAATADAEAAGSANLELRVGDVYALDLADGSFDVVHAHQVLQHLADPVAALREMRRVCRPGGLVAARDSIYRAMTWFPAEPGLDRWLEVYCAVAEANGGEPDAGSHLLSWAQAAGFDDIRCTATAWCYATPDERKWWSELWADRTSSTALADRAVELGEATREELAELAEAWRRWGAHDDAWFAVPCGEILALTT